MNYDEITKITAERISDYMTEAVNTDSIAVAEMFHNAAFLRSVRKTQPGMKGYVTKILTALSRGN